MPDDVTRTVPAPRARRLRRSASDRDLAGVLGGTAEALGVESSWLRLAVVAATGFLAFGIGDGAQLLVLVPYAVAWAVLPVDGGRALLAQIPRRAALQELALIALLLVVSTVVATQPGLAVVAALGAAGALLLRDRPPEDRRSSASPSAAPAPLPPVPHGEVGAPSGEGWPTDDGSGDVPPAPAPDPPPERRRRPRRVRREPALWPLAAALVVLVGVVALAGLVAGVVVDVRVVVNVLLLVVGGVMALSVWRGRAALLLLACPLLLPVWFATSAADIGGQEGIGRRREHPTAVGPEGSLDYELGYGLLEVDLTGLDLAPGSRTEVALAVSVGAARVSVPAGARLEVVGEVGLGVVDVPTDRWGGEPRPAAHHELDVQRGPVHPRCDPVQTSAVEVRWMAEQAGIALPPPTGAEGAADPEVLEAIAAAGFPSPQVVDEESWYGEEGLEVADIVEVHASDEFALCRPVAPEPDPPVVVLDATIGFGALEVHRV